MSSVGSAEPPAAAAQALDDQRATPSLSDAETVRIAI
jgi:hypothetical protein